MADPRRDQPLHVETSRSLWIGWGVQGLSLGLAILVGGTFFGYLFVFGSIVMVLRGWKPSWFAEHFDEQVIAGIPYRRKESFKRWSMAGLAALALSVSSALSHRRIFPEQDLAKVIIDGVGKFIGKQHPIDPAKEPSNEKRD